MKSRRAAIYARVSTSDQRPEVQLDRQVQVGVAVEVDHPHRQVGQRAELVGLAVGVHQRPVGPQDHP